MPVSSAWQCERDRVISDRQPRGTPWPPGVTIPRRWLSPPNPRSCSQVGGAARSRAPPPAVPHRLSSFRYYRQWDSRPAVVTTKCRRSGQACPVVSTPVWAIFCPENEGEPAAGGRQSWPQSCRSADTSSSASRFVLKLLQWGTPARLSPDLIDRSPPRVLNRSPSANDFTPGAGEAAASRPGLPPGRTSRAHSACDQIRSRLNSARRRPRRSPVTCPSTPRARRSRSSAAAGRRAKPSPSSCTASPWCSQTPC